MRQVLLFILITSCAKVASTCELVRDGFGPKGSSTLGVEVLVRGLEVPWALAFFDKNSFLVSERPGRVRLFENGALVAEPVLTLDTASLGEGGLLGIALLPKDPSRFVAYYSTPSGNRVERFHLDAGRRHATSEGVILEGIASARFHDGGRVRFGPDGALYVGTGDATKPELSQDMAKKNGKILRDGAVFVSGVRNVQAFDWLADGRLLVVDHGPSGELGRTGHDELSIARKGDNLGWPTIFGCEKKAGLVTPLLSWETAVPPGGVAIVRSGAWRGNAVIASLGARHLHRVVLNADATSVVRHEVYFEGKYGRLREAIIGPDGALYLTTSNCDGRGDCPADKDQVLRVTLPL